ncbi:hypothetical protein ACJ72_01933 [Emergomyces africanus]|uniref:UBC core domain-containing protein n=1 Tax=Emergomyces africanus TaxID=1955775 RepID=A0A1B7P3Y7_9EURO|nr:hypothetical protein ACJ72_01933 [Emergomyces africanus]
MASSLRRLASDHASLHNEGMPPNYLFPPTNTFSPFPDDLTQLTVLLTGPQGTPYSQGLWQLHLRMPEDYPKSPPKAAFKTRIWHPNVDESTGAVCVDTLKRDWEAKLTLRDVLITISCLLIHPNPDSALNSAAGSLLQADYEAFARQAKLMTSIHAPIPKDMKDAVMEAKRRGDESGTVIAEDEDRPATLSSRKTTTTSTFPTVVMKKPAAQKNPKNQRMAKLDIRVREVSMLSTSQSSGLSRDRQPSNEDDSDTEDTGSASKENDPSLSPSPVTITPPSSQKSVLGKRPLAVLASPSEPDMVLVHSGDTDVDGNSLSSRSDDDGMTPSERNIVANTLARELQLQLQPQQMQQVQTQEQPRKCPKLSELSRCVNDAGRVRDDYHGQDSRCNGGSQVNRSSRQSSIFGATTQPQPLPQPSNESNEKRTDGGKENDEMSAPPSSIMSASQMATGHLQSSAPAPHKTKASSQALLATSSISSMPQPSNIDHKNKNNNNNNNNNNNKNKNDKNNLTARKISSATTKAKQPRVGLRRL